MRCKIGRVHRPDIFPAVLFGAVKIFHGFLLQLFILQLLLLNFVPQLFDVIRQTIDVPAAAAAADGSNHQRSGSRTWRQISQATLGYGYGISVTPLQLTQAYAALGNDGRIRPVSLVALDRPNDSERIIGIETAESIRSNLARSPAN